MSGGNGMHRDLLQRILFSNRFTHIGIMKAQSKTNTLAAFEPNGIANRVAAQKENQCETKRRFTFATKDVLSSHAFLLMRPHFSGGT